MRQSPSLDPGSGFATTTTPNTHGKDDDNDEDYEDDPLVEHTPFEIGDEVAVSGFGGLSETSSRHQPLFGSSRIDSSRPAPKILFPDIGNTRGSIILCRLGRIKVIVICTVAAILAASATLVMMNTFKSTTSDSSLELGDDEPNPPALPDSVILFHPPKNEQEIELMRTTLKRYSDPIITWEEFSKNQGDKTEQGDRPDFTYTTANHFSTQRTALLFAPGTYPNLDFEVGYYTSVLGLGSRPTDVQFTDCDKGPHVPAMEKYTNRPPNGSGLDTFWRSIENIATDAREGMRWAVSQAAPMRRVHVRTDLNLYDADSWVSGGVAANVIVDGKVNFGGQQQWLMRNVELRGGAENGAWSLVFVGCTRKVPEESDGMEGGPSISVENNPIIRVEKPYIALKTIGRSLTEEDSGSHANEIYQLELRVPSVTYGEDATGPQFEDKQEEIRDFRRVKLAVPSNSADSTTAAIENHSSLQKALDAGKDLVLSPGIYPLYTSLKVKHQNQVILGIGYATLKAPEDGSPCISVESRVPGVRIAGIMLEASVLNGEREGKTASLLEWGASTSNDPGDESNPGILSDVFARVGGLLRDVSTDVMIRLHSGNIYGDNLWLWRADHVQLGENEEPNFPHISRKYWQTEQGECKVKNGLVVESSSSNVTIVGLAIEHTTEDQIIWNGDHGEQVAAIDLFLFEPYFIVSHKIDFFAFLR